jgi:uncharacterized membrane protein
MENVEYGYGEFDNNDKDVSTWYNILGAAMKLPGAKVNRNDFLKKQFSKYYNKETINSILQMGTIRANVDSALLDKIADDVIKYHTQIVTGISFAAGIPGGFAMLAAIPTDIAQFFYNVFSISQKLAYVYGWQDLGEDTSDDFKAAITLFTGVMSGVQAANQGIKQLTRVFMQKGVARIIRKGVGNTVIYKIAAQVAKMLGIQMSRQLFGKILSKIVPVFGGIISGALSLATFLPMAKNLKNKLREDGKYFLYTEEEYIFRNTKNVTP